MPSYKKFKTERLGKDDMERLLRFRPPEEVPGPPSRLVSGEGLELAGLRLQVEEALRTSCGENRFAQLVHLGPETATILIKIARAKQECECCCNLRSAAIAALGGVKHSAAPDTLISIIDDFDEDAGVRAQAAISAGRLGTPSCVARLQSALESDQSSTVRQAAATGLGESGSLEALRTLEKAIENDKDAGVKWLAYASLRALEKRYRQKLSKVKSPVLPKRGKPLAAKPPAIEDTQRKMSEAGEP